MEAILLSCFYFVLSIVDFVSIWVGRLLAIFFCAGVCFLFIYYFFRIPYCYKCGSRRIEPFLVGNNDGGYRCEKCGTYYWYKGGKSLESKPVK